MDSMDPKISREGTYKSFLHGCVGILGLFLVVGSPFVSVATVGGAIPLAMSLGGAVFLTVCGYLEGGRFAKKRLQAKYHTAYLKMRGDLVEKNHAMATTIQILETKLETAKSDGYKQGLSQGYQKAQEESKW
jgi:hypothetical protein